VRTIPTTKMYKRDLPIVFPREERHTLFLLHTECVFSITHVVWVKILLKTDSGYPKDAGVTLVEHPGKPYEFPLFLDALVSVSFLLQTSFLLYAPFLLHTWCVFPIGCMSCTHVSFLLPSTCVSFLWPSIHEYDISIAIR